MIKIVIPATNVDHAIDIRDRIQGLILVKGETAEIGQSSVVITTENPTRVCLELQADGFF